MTTRKKFNSALLLIGCAAVLAAAASPASAQSTTQPSVQFGPQSGSIGVKAVRERSRVRVTADIALPVGSSVSARLQLGKRVLCKMAKRKQVTEGAPTRIACTFPAKYLKVKKSGAKSSQAEKPTLTQEQYATLVFLVSLAALAEDAPPVVLAIPLAWWSLVATSND